MSATGVNRRQALSRFGSLVAASPLLQAQQAPQLAGEPAGRIAPRGELINVLEFAPMAERKLNGPTYASIDGGDRSFFERITLHQRLMVNTLELNLSDELFGTPLFAPIVVGPASSGIVAVSTTAVGGLLAATRTSTDAAADPPFPSEIV